MELREGEGVNSKTTAAERLRIGETWVFSGSGRRNSGTRFC